MEPKKWSTTRREPFFIKQHSGYLDVKQSMLLDVYFEPKHHGLTRYNLKFVIATSNDDYVIPLRGHGFLPHLKINELYNLFDNVLPYTENVEKLLIIKNTTMMPIEFCFSDFDR